MNNILTLNPVILRPLIIRWRFSLKTWLILGSVLLGSLLAFYVFQINEITQAGFFISNYERQIAEFSQESQILETDFSRLSSLVNLETILSDLNYEKVGKIHYLRVPGSTALAK